jgi:hypothetical protein
MNPLRYPHSAKQHAKARQAQRIWARWMDIHRDVKRLEVQSAFAPTRSCERLHSMNMHDMQDALVAAAQLSLTV